MDEKRAVPSDHEQRKQYQFEVRRIFLHDSQKVPVKYVKKDLKYPWNAHKEYARLLLIQSDEVRGKRVENRFPVQRDFICALNGGWERFNFRAAEEIVPSFITVTKYSNCFKSM